MSAHTKRATIENLRASLWVWPTLAASVAFMLTLALLNVRPAQDAGWPNVLWPSGTEAASNLLQVVATAIMTATTLTFSLTVVALQLASQQFSPRLLREFARDAKTQSVLALLVSTFVVAITGLRGMAPDRPTPVLVPALVLVLAVVSVCALVAFVGHIVRALRVDSMMVHVHEESLATLRETYPDENDHSKDPQPELPGPEGGIMVKSSRSGFVKVILPTILVEIAAKHGIFIRMGIRPGDQLIIGAPLATFWAGENTGYVDPEALEAEMAPAVEVGFERTSEQDAALGLRQLTDIAVKAISPSINDPITAAHAVSYCADLLVRLQASKLGSQQHVDGDGRPRVITPDRDYRYYQDLVSGPIRRYGSSEPLVLAALLRMYRDCASNAHTAEHVAEIRRQVELLLEAMDQGLPHSDSEMVDDLARRVELALQGELQDAYLDRAGETRSA